MIHSQAFSPQTNDLVEKGNDIARGKIASWIASTSRSDVSSEIALKMNISPCRAHPKRLNPYMAFFKCRAEFPVSSFNRADMADNVTHNDVLLIESGNDSEEQMQIGQFGSAPIVPEPFTSKTTQFLIEESPEVLREPSKASEPEPSESGRNQDAIHFVPREVPVITFESKVEMTEDDVDSTSSPSTSHSSHSPVNIEDVKSTFDESSGTIYETSDESVKIASEQTIEVSSDDASELLGEYPDPPSAWDHEDLLAFHTG